MNNMAFKRRRWRQWERYVKRCIRHGLKKPTAGMGRYLTQRMTFHNRRVDRQNELMLDVMSSLTGLTREELGSGGRTGSRTCARVDAG